MQKTRIVNPQKRFLLYYFNIDFRSEVPHIDEIRYGKQHVLKEVMKLADKMKILCQLRIKSFIPIGRRSIHTNERIKGIALISGKRESQHSI